MAKILIVIAPEGYQDIEYKDPKTVLENSGHQTITASAKKIATGSLGGETKVDILLKDVSSNDYDGIIFVGGPGSHIYFNDKTAQNLAKEFYNSKKLTCAICAAPSILANAGILEGKKVTSYPGESENLKNKGAIFTDQTVEEDGNIITGSGPGAAKDFGKKIEKALREK